MDNKEIIACIDQRYHIKTCKHCDMFGNNQECASYRDYADASIIHDDLKELEYLLE